MKHTEEDMSNAPTEPRVIEALKFPVRGHHRRMTPNMAKPIRSVKRKWRVGDHVFWPPPTSPVYWVEPRQSILMRFQPAAFSFTTTLYGVRECADPCMLPRWMQDFAVNRQYISSFNPEICAMGANWTPDSRWKFEEDTEIGSLTKGQLTIKIRRTESGWQLLEAPNAYPGDHFDWGPFASRESTARLEDLQFIVEIFFERCMSDPMGTIAALDSDRPYKERRVWRKDICILPGYCLAWAQYMSNPRDDVGRMSKPDRPLRKPRGTDPSVRMGMSWLECTAIPSGKGYETWLNFINYALSIWRLCRTCGESPGHSWDSHPRISIKGGLTCRGCKEVLIDFDGEPMDGKFLTGMPEEDLIVMLYDPHMCGCGHYAVPQFELECSGGCDAPKPSELDQVITRAINTGDAWTFEVFRPDVMPTMYPDWSKTPATYPLGAGVFGPPVSVEDGYDPLFNPLETEYYPYLTPIEQVRFLGTDLFNFTNEAAEKGSEP